MDPSTYERMRALQARHWWFEGRRRILATMIGGLPIPRPARILEVGCGPGGNIAMLQRFGEVVAVEPDESSRLYAARISGARVESGRLPDGLPFPPAAFDLAAAFDVIEHVDEDRASVAAIGALVRPGGYMIATVPGQPWMWSRHDELHHHKRRYRLTAFRDLFIGAGLEVVKASYFNALLFPLIASVRAVKLAAGSTAPDDDGVPAAPLNAALTALFGSEGAWLQRADLPFGVSILVIARRPAA